MRHWLRESKILSSTSAVAHCVGLCLRTVTMSFNNLKHFIEVLSLKPLADSSIARLFYKTPLAYAKVLCRPNASRRVKLLLFSCPAMTVLYDLMHVLQVLDKFRNIITA